MKKSKMVYGIITVINKFKLTDLKKPFLSIIRSSWSILLIFVTLNPFCYKELECLTSSHDVGN